MTQPHNPPSECPRLGGAGTTCKALRTDHRTAVSGMWVNGTCPCDPFIADKDESEKALKKSFVPLEEIMFDECDNLTSDDILTCTYILLDLPTKEIVACSKYTDNSISSRKHRLRANYNNIT